MNNIVRIRMEAGRLPYETAAEKLVCSACPGIFPADVIRHAGDEKLEICYHVGGFQKLSAVPFLQPEEVIRLVAAVLYNLQICRDWFWFPEEYVLSEDTVYLMTPDKVCFTWIPDREQDGAEHRFVCLLHSLKKKTSERGRRYLDQCMEFISGGRNEWKQMAAHINFLLQQEQWIR